MPHTSIGWRLLELGHDVEGLRVPTKPAAGRHVTGAAGTTTWLEPGDLAVTIHALAGQGLVFAQPVAQCGPFWGSSERSLTLIYTIRWKFRSCNVVV